MSLAVLLAVVLGGVAQADTAMRCEAIWIGPAKKCGIQGEWAASGAGPNEAIARASAVARLVEAVGQSAELDVLRRPIALTDPKKCAEVAESGARVTCFEEPTLWEKRQCFVDLPVKDCGTLPMLELSGVQWRITEKGRTQMCKALDKHLAKAVPQIRAQCLSRCAQDVRVRCPREEGR